MAEGLSVALPLRTSEKDGPYEIHKEMEEVGKQHLKMIVLTSPGERVMDPAFGVGIRNYLFEQQTANISDDIRNRIKKQVETYAPFIKIMKINAISDPDQGTLLLGIKFSIPSSNIVSDLTIPVSS
jgi:hypothetical protein